MLVLSRKTNESILINNGEIKLTVLGIRGDKVRLGIVAPRAIPVHREEVLERIRKQNEKPDATSSNNGPGGNTQGDAPDAAKPRTSA